MSLLVSNLKRVWEVRQPSGILCHRFKFIYFPVSKAGGSSTKIMIAEMEGLPITGNPHNAVPFEWVRAKDLDRYPDYKRFAIVRNPWARILSCYRDKVYWQRLESGEIIRRQKIFAGFARYNRLLRRELFHPNMTFDEFVRIVARIPDVFSDRHFRSQHKEFCQSNGTPFVEHLIRMEAYQEQMQSFLSSVGADGFDIKHEHKTRKSKRSEQFDDELAGIVARRYRRDIELLHYAGP